MKEDFLLIDKAIFLPKSGILAIGDLHIGYEEMLRSSGIEIKLNQLDRLIKDTKKLILNLHKNKLPLRKIILLGDIKQSFSFNREESRSIRDYLNFLENEVGTGNLILIKGNHEKFEPDNRHLLDYHIEKDTAFTHGDKSFPEIYDKKIKTIILAHLHPAILLKEKNGVKREKYKCFLIGKSKKKKIIILPSFFSINEGSILNHPYQYKNSEEDFSIIPRKNLGKFNVLVPDSNGKILDFGKLKNLD